jgi:hypothetical protein
MAGRHSRGCLRTTLAFIHHISAPTTQSKKHRPSASGVCVAATQNMITPDSPQLSGLLTLVLFALLCLPQHAAAQQSSSGATGTPQNQPPAVQRAEADVERNAKRWRLGVQGGVGLDPEILHVGVHAEFGPIFNRNVEFRPVFELGAGEITTTLGINLDGLYLFPGASTDTRWLPYVGAGPNLGWSHRSLDVEMTTRSSTTTPRAPTESIRFQRHRIQCRHELHCRDAKEERNILRNEGDSMGHPEHTPPGRLQLLDSRVVHITIVRRDRPRSSGGRCHGL